MRKALRQDDNTYRCSKCEGSFNECDYRYILRLHLQDHTGHLDNVVALEEAATALLGVSAKDLCLLSTDPESVFDIYNKIKGRHFLFTLSLKRDRFNGVERLCPNLIHAEELVYDEASTTLLEALQSGPPPANPF